MSKVWDEAVIREEIIKLDKKTGLNGSALPIRFNCFSYILGSYHVEPDNNYFMFSELFFKNPDWPEEEAIGVIRHEYAHYMNHKIYGCHGHGKTWMHCCNQIGAPSYEYHDPEMCKHSWDKIAMEKKAEQYAASSIGKSIEHPGFGTGIITAVTGDSINCRITVDFPGVGSKTLGFVWVDKNCRMIG